MTKKAAVAKPVRLVSKWFALPGEEKVVLPAIAKLAKEVLEREPGTLMYLVHTPYADQATLRSIPPPEAGMILFFEMYASPAAFDAHVNGKLFKRFVARYGKKFVPLHEKPFTTCEFLHPYAGFVRS